MNFNLEGYNLERCGRKIFERVVSVFDRYEAGPRISATIKTKEWSWFNEVPKEEKVTETTC